MVDLVKSTAALATVVVLDQVDLVLVEEALVSSFFKTRNLSIEYRKQIEIIFI